MTLSLVITPGEDPRKNWGFKETHLHVLKVYGTVNTDKVRQRVDFLDNDNERLRLLGNLRVTVFRYGLI